MQNGSYTFITKITLKFPDHIQITTKALVWDRQIKLHSLAVELHLGLSLC